MVLYSNYFYIGVIGLCNVGLLTLITTWRLFRCVAAFRSVGFQGRAFRRKLALHMFLLLATLCDLPMFVSFVLVGQYEVATYSFHKLEAAFIFAAFSITIGDWSSVLFDIREETQLPFFFRRATLVTANVINFTISVLNCIFCLMASGGDMGQITGSMVYQVGEFAQVVLTAVIMGMLLHTGLKLAWRIHGVTGGTSPASAHPAAARRRPVPIDTVNRISGTSAADTVSSGTTTQMSLSASSGAASTVANPMGVTPQKQQQGEQQRTPGSASRQQRAVLGSGGLTVRNSSYSAGFHNALSRLNCVMLICTVCFLMQITMSSLNIVLGYDTDANRYVGGIYLFWTLYAWIPLWGTILSLLLLSRTALHNNRKNRNRGNTAGASESEGPAESAERLYQPPVPHMGASQRTSAGTGTDSARHALLDGDEEDENDDNASDGSGRGGYGEDGAYSSVHGVGGGNRMPFGTPANVYASRGGGAGAGGAYYSDVTTMSRGRDRARDKRAPGGWAVETDAGCVVQEIDLEDGEGSGFGTSFRSASSGSTGLDDGSSAGRRPSGEGDADWRDPRMSMASGVTGSALSTLGRAGVVGGGMGRGGVESVQNSDLYNYDVQAAFQGGNYSYRYSTVSNVNMDVPNGGNNDA